MTNNDRWSIAVAAGLCALGGWVGDPIWASAIGFAIGGSLMAIAKLSKG